MVVQYLLTWFSHFFMKTNRMQYIIFLHPDIYKQTSPSSTPRSKICKLIQSRNPEGENQRSSVRLQNNICHLYYNALIMFYPSVISIYTSYLHKHIEKPFPSPFTEIYRYTFRNVNSNKELRICRQRECKNGCSYSQWVSKISIDSLCSISSV